MQHREDILFSNGMNRDDDPRWFKQGDYYEARNVRVGHPQEQGDGGLVQTLRSTLKRIMVGPTTGAAVSPKILGAATDEVNDRAYIFTLVLDDFDGKDNQLFTIYKHDLRTDTIKAIFAQLAEDFDIKSYSATNPNAFYNPRIVDDKLIWTDNKNEVRMIDVVRAENTFDAGILGEVIAWDEGFALGVGYAVGTLVYSLDRVYRVIQFTQFGPTGDPSTLPAYYTDIAAVVDVYLDPSDTLAYLFAAKPPLNAPQVLYRSDSSRNTNQLRNRTWQFSYRYEYIDFRQSTFAPPSLVPEPSLEEDVFGVPVPDPTFNNSIEVTINTGSVEVRSVELIVRSSEDPATWFLWNRLEMFSDENERVIESGREYRVRFYNDSLAQAISNDVVLVPFTFVPIRAKHMELIEGNRIALANITEGYPRLQNIGIFTEIYYETFPNPSDPQRRDFTINSVLFNAQSSSIWALQFTLPENAPTDGVISIVINQGFGEQRVEYSWNTAGSDVWPTDVRQALIDLMDAEWGAGTVSPCLTTVDNSRQWCAFQKQYLGQWSVPDPYAFWTTEMYIIETNPTTRLVEKRRLLKPGSVQSWGLIYRDALGRQGPINGIDELSVYIPFYTENTSVNLVRVPNVNFQINHLPPDWAESYEIVYYGNRTMTYWLHHIGYNFAYAKTDHDDPEDLGYVDGKEDEVVQYRLRIKKAAANMRSYNSGWSVEEYVWQEGDRIRIIGKVSSLGVVSEIDGYIYDAKITAVFTDTDNGKNIGEEVTAEPYQYEWIYFEVRSDLNFRPTRDDPTGTNIFPDNLYVEIYRPAEIESTLFFTSGMTFPISKNEYGDKFHEGDTNQVLTPEGDPSGAAVVQNRGHDGWKYLRTFRDNPPDGDVSQTVPWINYADSQYSSDYNRQQILTSQGFPIPILEGAKQNVLPQRLRHGGIIPIGSQNNFIARFDPLDFLDLKDEDGPIDGIREIGFTLKCVQYTRVVSIYLSRQESFTAAGDPTYLFTDKVFGSTRPSNERWGTSHPESVAVHNRNLYFWDQTEGIMVRDSPNGQIEISAYKMKRWFTDKSQQQDTIAEPAEQIAITAYSQEFDEVMVSFGKADPATKEATEMIVFDESNQRWRYFVDFSFDYGRFYWVGKRLFHVQEDDDGVYEWWSGTDYLNIGATNQTGSINFYTKADPQKIRTFDAVHVYQTGARPVFNTIEVPAKASAIADGVVMQTDIADANIEEKEGVFYCQILRDQNDPDPASGPNVETKRLNGRRLRGLYAYVSMNFIADTVPITLSNVAVVSTASERSK